MDQELQNAEKRVVGTKQVLRALKSIDSNFGALVDGQLGKIDESKMEVICLSDKEIQRRKEDKG